jgi:Trk K+ transport system NAD-binding subunit
LVTGDPQANLEAALAAQHLKPKIQIVARAAEGNINELLTSIVDNLVLYEPNRLAAGALSLAALHSELAGYFRLEGRLLRVTRHQVRQGDPWADKPIEHANAHGVVVLLHERPAGKPVEGGGSIVARPFHRYELDDLVREGDILTLLLIGNHVIPDEAEMASAQSSRTSRPSSSIAQWVATRFRTVGRATTVVIGAGFVIAVAALLAVALFPMADPSLTRADGFFSALVLMTGGTYADLFPAFHQLSNGIRLFAISLSVIGTVAVGLLYAWLTERLMTLRLRLPRRRPAAPTADHVIVVGLGRVGQNATTVLAELGRRSLAIESEPVDEHTFPNLAVMTGNGGNPDVLRGAQVERARGLLAATANDWLNLEIALVARKLNPDCALVIRTKDTRFSENISGLLPNLRVICVPVIAARAFAVAALGENVLDLFRIENRTVYVVEYLIGANDGLDGRLVAEVAEGYSVVPLLHQHPGREARFWSPLDRAVRLEPGDRLILLGTSQSLKNVEHGQIDMASTKLVLRGLRTYADTISMVAVFAQHLAYPLERAHEILSSLPAELPAPLYPHQARRIRALLEGEGAIVELG